MEEAIRQKKLKELGDEGYEEAQTKPQKRLKRILSTIKSTGGGEFLARGLIKEVGSLEEIKSQKSTPGRNLRIYVISREVIGKDGWGSPNIWGHSKRKADQKELGSRPWENWEQEGGQSRVSW